MKLSLKSTWKPLDMYTEQKKKIEEDSYQYIFLLSTLEQYFLHDDVQKAVFHFRNVHQSDSQAFYRLTPTDAISNTINFFKDIQTFSKSICIVTSLKFATL